MHPVSASSKVFDRVSCDMKLEDRATGFFCTRLCRWVKARLIVLHSAIMETTVMGTFLYVSFIAKRHLVTFAKEKVSDATARLIDKGSIACGEYVAPHTVRGGYA